MPLYDKLMFYSYLLMGIRRADEDGVGIFLLHADEDREGIFLLPRCASKNAVPSTYDAVPRVCDNPMFHNYLSKGIRRADEDGAGLFLLRADKDREGVFLLQRRASKNAVPSTCDKMMLHSYLLKGIRAGHVLLVRFLALQILFLMISVR
jgi:hypothetical protein